MRFVLRVPPYKKHWALFLPCGYLSPCYEEEAMLPHIVSIKMPQFPVEMDDSIMTYWKRSFCPSNLISCTEVLKSMGFMLYLETFFLGNARACL